MMLTKLWILQRYGASIKPFLFQPPFNTGEQTTSQVKIILIGITNGKLAATEKTLEI